jgi:L-lactate dehydrogenase
MKVSIIGVGRVGSATAFALVTRGLIRELVLVGSDRAKSEGEAADLQHACAFVRPIKVVEGTLDDTAGSDIVIVTASVPDRGGGRLVLAGDNARLYSQLIPQLARTSPGSILVVVSNPVDVMTLVALRHSGFAPHRVIGTGTLIDTGRFRAILSETWQINPADVRAYILGEHGDSQFPALSVASAGGVKFDQHDAFVHAAAEQARNAGHEVFQKKGYTNYAIALATAMIVEAIADDTHAVLPVSTLIEGYLGVRDVCLSVPCVIGREGVVRMLPVDLNGMEAELFRRSAQVLKGVVDSIQNV